MCECYFNQSLSLPNEITDDAEYFVLGRRLDWHFHEIYCHIDSSQHNDLKLVSIQRGGVRLHNSLANMSKKNPSGHESLSTLTFWTCLVHNQMLREKFEHFFLGIWYCNSHKAQFKSLFFLNNLKEIIYEIDVNIILIL